jgi:cob(I)alamin adenosyltransferase
MVTLSKITTRTGDDGETSLGDGTRVPKTHARVEAYACVDEANAAIGVAVLHADHAVKSVLLHAQNDLFDLGADLCVPQSPGNAGRLRVSETQIAWLEKQIERSNAGLAPLKSFVLPGGTAAAAHLHVARTVARRAERAVWALAATEEIGPSVAVYLNRLSDLLFVLARAENARAEGDVLWVPGASRQG